MEKEKILSEMPFLKERKTSDGIASFECRPADLPKAAKILRDKFEFQSLNDIAAVDMGECAARNGSQRTPRIAWAARRDKASVHASKFIPLCKVARADGERSRHRGEFADVVDNDERRTRARLPARCAVPREPCCASARGTTPRRFPDGRSHLPPAQGRSAEPRNRSGTPERSSDRLRQDTPGRSAR